MYSYKFTWTSIICWQINIISYVFASVSSHIPQFGDAGSPAGDVDVSPGHVDLRWETTASPNFGICDTTRFEQL